MPSTLQLVLPMLAAACTAVAVDLAVTGQGAPPGFAVPWRRAVASGLLAGLLFLGTFASLALVVPGETIDVSGASWTQIFNLHALILITLGAWGVLAWAGFEAGAPAAGASPEAPAGDPLPWRLEAESEPPPSLGRRLAAEFRLAVAAPGSVLGEIGLGLGGGVVVWLAFLVAMAVVGAVTQALGGGEMVSRDPSPLIDFLAAQPFAVRLGASLSAGFCEELFFRGFLQPRLGVAFSSLLFVLAHWSYGEPFMLIGVLFLSLAFAALARWRRNVWAAVAAHAVFDAIQLLVFLPHVVEQMGKTAGG